MKFGKTIRLIAMLGLTGGFFLVEIIVGYMTGSMALVADSFHMLSDVVALLIGLLSVRISRKTSENNTFGWARAEVLGALVNAVFLCALCFSIFIESIERFVDGVPITNPFLVLIVGIVGLVVNILGLFLFHDHSHGGHSHGHSHSHGHDHVDIDGEQSDSHDHSHSHNHPETTVQITSDTNGAVVVKKKIANSAQMNMKGVFLHVAGDALGSVVVIIAAAVIWKTDWEYKNYIDPAMSMLSVVVILAMTIPLLRSSALILLQTVPLHIKARDVKARLAKVDGVLAVHELHIWQLAGNRIVASAHIWCKDYPAYKRSANQIKEFFHNEGIHSITIQPEFEDFDDTGMYASITPRDPSFCGLVCPEDKKCDENMCCKPSRPASRRNSTGHLSSGISMQNLEAGLHRHLDDDQPRTEPHRVHSAGEIHHPHPLSKSHRHSGRLNTTISTSTPSIVIQPEDPSPSRESAAVRHRHDSCSSASSEKSEDATQLPPDYVEPREDSQRL